MIELFGKFAHTTPRFLMHGITAWKGDSGRRSTCRCRAAPFAPSSALSDLSSKECGRARRPVGNGPAANTPRARSGVELPTVLQTETRDRDPCVGDLRGGRAVGRDDVR